MAARVVMRRANIKDEIIEVLSGLTMPDDVDELNVCLYVLGKLGEAEPEHEVRFQLFVRAAEVAIGRIQKGKLTDSRLLAYLHENCGVTQCRKFLPHLQTEIQKWWCEVDQQLRQAFLDRLSSVARNRYDELDAGDVLESPNGARGLVTLNLSRQQLVKLLTYSKGKFELFEKEQFLPDLNDINFGEELGLKSKFKVVQPKTLLQRFKEKADDLGLEPEETIPRETLFEIMKELGEFKGTLDAFTPSCKECKRGRTMASKMGKSRKGSAERN